MTLDIINRDNVTDDATLNLDDVGSIATAVVGGVTYLFATSPSDNGVSVFTVGADGVLSNVSNITDSALLDLTGVSSVATAVVGGDTYVYVTATGDNSVSTFRVLPGGGLGLVATVADDASLALAGTNSLATAAVGGVTYLFVTGQFDNGVSVFAVGADGMLTNVDNVFDDATLNLDVVFAVTTASVGSSTYLFAAGVNGLSAFQVDSGGSLTNVLNIADSASLAILAANSLTTAVVDGVTYLFASSFADSGVSVFEVRADGFLTNVDTIYDSPARSLRGASAVSTVVVGGTTYLFVAGFSESGVSVFAVGAGGSLSPVANITDDATLELQAASSVATGLVAGTPYLFVAGEFDDGVSTFELATDDTLIGTGAADTLDGGGGDDVIIGLGDDDVLIGGSGTDTLIGGTGDDTLTGGAGNDNLQGDAGTDTAVFSGNQADYLVTALGNGGFEVSDQRGGSPDGTDTLDGIENITFADGTISLVGNAAPTGLALSHNTIAENSVAGALVGALSASDPDAGETFTYQLLDDAGGRFALNGNLLEVAGGLDFEAAGSHQVTVRVTDAGGLSHDETFTIGVTDVAEGAPSVSSSGLSIINRDNVTDDATLELGGALGVTTAVVAGTTYLFVAGANDSGVSVFAVGADGSLANVANVADDATLNLQGARSVTTGMVGGTTYLFVAGQFDNGVSVFAVGADGSLANVANISDNAFLNLADVSSVATAVVGGVTYLFVTAGGDSSVTVFQVNPGGGLGLVATVADDATLELEGANSVTTGVVGGVTYLFVAGNDDSGVSVFAVGAGGSLTNVANVTDDATLNLRSVSSVTTAVVGGTTYLFAAGENGASVFEVGIGGALLNVDNVTDDATLNLQGARSVTTAVIGGTTYLFVAGANDSGVSAFAVGDDGSLTPAADVADDATLELFSAFGVTTAEAGGSNYLFAIGRLDDGVSVFELATDDTLLGTNGADTLDGRGGSDLIVGLGGDDLLTGGDGSDTVLGGNGNDTLTGGAGDDDLHGDAGTDTAVFSGNQADYLITALGNGRFEVSDQRGGSPDGTDTLDGIESIAFADGTISLVGNAAPTGLALSRNTIAENSAAGALVGALSASDPDAGDTFTYQLLDDAGGRFALNGNLLEVAGGLDFEAAGSHQVTVRVTDAGGLSHDETFTIGVTDVAESAPSVSSSGLSIINRDNVTDDATLPLDGAIAVATAVVGGVSYLFVAGSNENGISVFSVGADGALTAVASVADDATLLLANLLTNSLTTATVGGTTYLVAAGGGDNGLSVFRIGADGSLANVFNVADDATLNLDTARSVAIVEIGGVSYLFAGGAFDNGVSVFTIGADGSLTNVANVSDDATLQIDGVSSIATALVGGVPYLFVAGQFDSGVSVFAIGADGALTNVANVADDAALELSGTASVTTALIGGTTYLFAAGSLDDGVSVFAVGNDGSLTNVANVGDDATLSLFGAISVTTAVVGGTTYLLVAGRFDSGVGVFAVGNDGSLSHVANIDDSATLELDLVVALTTATTGGSTYLFAAGNGDNGVSVFELASDDTLVGTDGPDVLDGLGGTDLIVGLDGDDALIGGRGNDRLIGGNGNDTLTGGAGDDTLQGDAGNDTAVFSGNRADYRITALGNGAFEVSDQRAGSADGTDRLDGIENAAFADGAINLVAGRLDGGDGDDLLRGGAGNDTLTGGAGNDFIDGGVGLDTLIGGTGNDRYFVDDARDAVVELLDGGFDVVFSTVDVTLADHIEILSLAVGNAVTGTGNAQGNTIFGNAGDNVLDGGGGGDSLSGLGGNDTFVFRSGEANGDIVYEFEGNGAGVGDLLQFSGYGTAAQGATFTQQTATEWFITSADGLIQEVITLVGGPTVDASDYVFI